MSHRSKVTGKYLHSTITGRTDLDGKERERFQYTWESTPERVRSLSYKITSCGYIERVADHLSFREFPHNNKTLIKVTGVDGQTILLK